MTRCAACLTRFPTLGRRRYCSTCREVRRTASRTPGGLMPRPTRPHALPRPRRRSHAVGAPAVRPDLATARHRVIAALEDGPMTFGELCEATSSPRSVLLIVLRALAAEQVIVDGITGNLSKGKTTYRLARRSEQVPARRVRTVPIPPLDVAERDRRIRAACAGASAGLDEVYRSVRSRWPQVTREDVAAVLETDPRIEPIACGPFTRYRLAVA